MSDASRFDEISEASAAAAVGGDLQDARGLPNEAYTSRSFWQRERDTVVGATWAAIAFSSDVTTSGLTTPIDFMGLPLFMVRDHNGVVRVFHNVCSHRGMQLVSEPTEAGLMIRCPYHRWGYDLTGQLKNTPNIGGMGVHQTPGFDCSQHGLREVRSEEYFGVVFINLSGNAPPLRDHLSVVTERWQALAGANFMDQLTHDAAASGSIELMVNCNYKLAVENYCESYHLPFIHPGLNAYSPLDQHYNLIVGEVASGQGTHTYDLERGSGTPLPVFPGWNADRLKTGEYLSLYPNVLLGLQADHFFAIILLPEAPDRTRERLQFMYVGQEALAEQMTERRQGLHEAWALVFSEDVSVVEGMQRGRQSPGFQGGVFSPVMDVPTHHFHRWFAQQLQGAAPCQHPVSGTAEST